MIIFIFYILKNPKFMYQESMVSKGNQLCWPSSFGYHWDVKSRLGALKFDSYNIKNLTLVSVIFVAMHERRLILY